MLHAVLEMMTSVMCGFSFGFFWGGVSCQTSRKKVWKTSRSQKESSSPQRFLRWTGKASAVQTLWTKRAECLLRRRKNKTEERFKDIKWSSACTWWSVGPILLYCALKLLCKCSLSGTLRNVSQVKSTFFLCQHNSKIASVL